MNRSSSDNSAFCLAAAMIVMSVISLHADDTRETQRARLLQQMRELAQKTAVRLTTADRAATLVPNPVFRYDDQPRNFIDATMWVWTDQNDLPVAFQKIEAVIHVDTRKPHWGYCFTSMANQPLTVEWTEAKPYATTEAGLTLKPLREAPVAKTSAARKRQMGELARRFSARITLNPKTNSTAEMRLLPTPIYEFFEPETKRLRGAVYGFSSNGTNPDLLIMLQAVTAKGAAEWHFAPARMTTGGLKLQYDDETVWEAEFVSPHAGPFPNWTFFNTPREELPP
ncbi:MAG: hypothetical protein Q8K78_08115 [Planctomycetaceae bacterium]|nr:hypothetical protein [Planctomycetaceae bacterium]